MAAAVKLVTTHWVATDVNVCPATNSTLMDTHVKVRLFACLHLHMRPYIKSHRLCVRLSASLFCLFSRIYSCMFFGVASLALICQWSNLEVYGKMWPVPNLNYKQQSAHHVYISCEVLYLISTISRWFTYISLCGRRISSCNLVIVVVTCEGNVILSLIHALIPD